MRQTKFLIVKVSTLVLMLGSLIATSQSYAGGEMPSKEACESPSSAAVKGGCVMTDRKKGNCMACHQFKGIEQTTLQAGNIAPPLVAMKQRFPDKAKLRAQVWDATVANPDSSMPPFGRHKILSDDEIDSIVEFLSTL
ncbi:MAG: sulfur oxidation c-type cytochrome SoxX [Gammaproteobacteria bacterium]|nr:sulfur oxidation c-type cytochrome SoxX [Gammaproteobacteria bacterium]